MTDLKDNFIRLKKELALSNEEHDRMRAYLETISRPSEAVLRATPSFSLFSSLRPAWAGALALVLIVAGGGATNAASTALPGDTLYPLKVGISEKVQVALASGLEARAEVEVSHAEERLREVELLAARGDDDSRSVNDVIAQVEAHVVKAGSAARLLAADGDETAADNVQARIASALAAHAEILEAQADESESDPGLRLAAIARAVGKVANTADDERDEDTDREKPDDSVIALARQESAEERISEVAKELAEEGIPAETHAELSSELAAVQADFATAGELIENGEDEDAGRAYEKVEQRAYRTLAFLVSAKRISEKTGKEVVIRLGENDAANTVTEEAVATVLATEIEEAPMAKVMLMAVPAPEATTSASTSAPVIEPVQKQRSGGRLHFFLRDPQPVTE